MIKSEENSWSRSHDPLILISIINNISQLSLCCCYKSVYSQCPAAGVNMMLDIILTVIFQTGMKIIDWVMRGRGLRSGGTETQLSSSYNLVLWNFWLMEILRLNLGTILLEWNVVLFSRNLSRKRRTSYKKEWDFVVLQKFIKKDEGVIFEKRKLFCSSEIYLEWGEIYYKKKFICTESKTFCGWAEHKMLVSKKFNICG